MKLDSYDRWCSFDITNEEDSDRVIDIYFPYNVSNVRFNFRNVQRISFVEDNPIYYTDAAHLRVFKNSSIVFTAKRDISNFDIDRDYIDSALFSDIDMVNMPIRCYQFGCNHEIQSACNDKVERLEIVAEGVFSFKMNIWARKLNMIAINARKILIHPKSKLYCATMCDLHIPSDCEMMIGDYDLYRDDEGVSWSGALYLYEGKPMRFKGREEILRNWSIICKYLFTGNEYIYVDRDGNIIPSYTLSFM